jgi:hypothetical protein
VEIIVPHKQYVQDEGSSFEAGTPLILLTSVSHLFDCFAGNTMVALHFDPPTRARHVPSPKNSTPASEVGVDVGRRASVDFSGTQTFSIFDWRFPDTSYNLLGSAQAGVSITCVDCGANLTASFNMRFVLFAEYGFPFSFNAGIDHFSYTVSGQFVAAAMVQLDAQYQTSYEKAGNILKASLPRITFTIGPIPVWISPEIGLDYKLQANIDLKATVTFGAAYRYEASFGWAYNRGKGGDKFRNSGGTFTYTAPSVDSASGLMSAKMMLMPYAKLTLVSLFSVIFRLQPYVEGKLQMLTDVVEEKCTSRKNIFWDINAGADFVIEVPEITFDFTLSDIWSVLPSTGFKATLGKSFGLPYTSPPIVLVAPRPLASGCIYSDRCTISNGGCDSQAICKTILPFVRTCTCKAGYSGNGQTCTLTNPCAIQNGGCSSSASCTSSTVGSRTCTCNAGMMGDGTVCLPAGPLCSSSLRYITCPRLPTIGSECVVINSYPVCRCILGKSISMLHPFLT